MTSSTGSGAGAHVAMDKMYRHQRYIYDLTRKYYLFGRYKLIKELPVGPTDHICEVGCGTARNLVLLAKRNPKKERIPRPAPAAAAPDMTAPAIDETQA